MRLDIPCTCIRNFVNGLQAPPEIAVDDVLHIGGEEDSADAAALTPFDTPFWEIALGSHRETASLRN